MKTFSEMHEPHWVLRGAFQFLVFGLVFTEVMLAIAVLSRMDLAGGAARARCQPFDARRSHRPA